MRGAVGCYLSRSRAHPDSLRAAVVAHTVVHVGPVDDHVALINISDMHAAEVIDGTVVSEVVAMPVAALVADAHVAEAIIHAAVEADVATPVTAVESIAAADKTPVAGCPERALIGRLSPCAGNPVIARRCPSPVAGRPEVSRFGDGRLLIIRQRRRRLRRVVDRSVVVAGIAVVFTPA